MVQLVTSCAGLAGPEPCRGQEEECEPWGHCLVDKQDVYSVEEKEEAQDEAAGARSFLPAFPFRFHQRRVLHWSQGPRT